jgi:hypothetical protein
MIIMHGQDKTRRDKRGPTSRKTYDAGAANWDSMPSALPARISAPPASDSPPGWRRPRVHRFGAGDGGRAGASQAGLGWRGKHTLLLSREPARISSSARSTPTCRCRSMRRSMRIAARCTAASSVCPDRQPIVGPYSARRAALHFLPDHRAEGAASRKSLRRLIGNRVYGCDDCQLACPWNSFRATHAMNRISR